MDIHSIHLKRLGGQLGQIAYQLTRLQVSHSYSAQTWSPALNAYLCQARIVICVDLAGVERESLELRAEPRLLLIRGNRQAPEPQESGEKPLQTLAMEIDYGPFAREIELPVEIEPRSVQAHQRNGLLWIQLPLRSPG